MMIQMNHPHHDDDHDVNEKSTLLSMDTSKHQYVRNTTLTKLQKRRRKRNCIIITMISIFVIIIFGIILYYVLLNMNNQQDYYHSKSSYMDEKDIPLSIQYANDSLDILNHKYNKLYKNITKSTTTEEEKEMIAPVGCEATILIVRHCEGDDNADITAETRTCTDIGYERTHYIPTLFHNDEPSINNMTSSSSKFSSFVSKYLTISHNNKPQWSYPIELYSLLTDRGDHENIREYETLKPLSKSINVNITLLDYNNLIHTLYNELNSGMLCNHNIVICWKHSDIPTLAQSLGCSIQNGCPFHYYHGEYDQIWQIKLILSETTTSDDNTGTDDITDTDKDTDTDMDTDTYMDTTTTTTSTTTKKKKKYKNKYHWNVYGSVVYQHFVPSTKK